MLAGIVLAAALAATAPSQPIQQAPQVYAQQKSEHGVGGQDATNETRATLKNLAGDQQGEKADNARPDAAFLGIKPGEWLLAFVTLLLWYATMRLVWDAGKSSERQLRAYVFFTENRRATAHGQVMTFQVTIKNTGQTPAYEAVVKIGGKCGPCAEDVMPDFHDSKRPVVAIGPGEHLFSTWDTGQHGPISGPELVQIMAGTHAYFLRCRVDYVDAFKQPRHTEVIVAYTKANIASGSMGICDHGHSVN